MREFEVSCRQDMREGAEETQKRGLSLVPGASFVSFFTNFCGIGKEQRGATHVFTLSTGAWGYDSEGTMSEKATLAQRLFLSVHSVFLSVSLPGISLTFARARLV